MIWNTVILIQGFVFNYRKIHQRNNPKSKVEPYITKKIITKPRTADNHKTSTSWK